MSNLDQRETANILLKALSPNDYEILKPHLKRVDLSFKQVLVAPNEPVEYVYFPEGGIASIISEMERSGRTETGIFGREGVSATCLLLGTDRLPHECFMQVGNSTALRIDAEAYLATVRRSRSLQEVLLRYVQVSLIQAAQSAATNAQHRVEARLARWLLMCHDRANGDEIPLTHVFMSMMISADRSGVTVTLHILEGAGMIRSTRGLVTILDRDKLEDLAADSYGVPEAEYRRLIAPFGKSFDSVQAGSGFRD